MNKDDFYYLGKILKTHGNKGHLLVFLDVDNPQTYSDLKTIFIDIDNDMVPFFINSITLKSNKLASVILEDIESLEEARVLAGREMFLPANMLPQMKDQKFLYQDLTGYAVIDKKKGNIGLLNSVIELPYQSLLQIKNGEKEILIPLVVEILLKIDKRKKELIICAPEGLIDLYL